MGSLKERDNLKEVILLIGHGSRDVEGNEEFLRFAKNFQAQFADREVVSCFLELAEPTIPDGVDQCAKLGAQRVIVIPVILLAASHVKLEIPEFLDAARKKYPQIEFIYGRHLGLNEKIVDLLEMRYNEAIVEIPDFSKEETAIVLMCRGSSEPDANGDAYKLGRLLWERTQTMTVETCFTGITTPLFADGVRRAIALGAKRVVVVPYFLFTGILIKRMRNVLIELQEEFPAIPMTMAHYFGFHPLLLDIVVSQYEEAVIGHSFMNCDLCKYRKMVSSDHDHHEEA